MRFELLGLSDAQGTAALRALVTGAGHRVGAAIALRLGQTGMHVAVHYRSEKAGAESTAAAIREAGGEATLLQADLHDRDAARGLIDAAVQAMGGLDVLVLSAANFDRVAYDDIDDATWDRALSLNLSAPFWLAHAATPALKASKGTMVFITDADVRRPHRHYLPYLVSKGALKELVRVLARELAPDVRVNSVAPGTVLLPENFDAKTREALIARIPLGREGGADVIADAVAYLANAPFVTGTELVVDGGSSLA